MEDVIKLPIYSSVKQYLRILKTFEGRCAIALAIIRLNNEFKGDKNEEINKIKEKVGWAISEGIRVKEAQRKIFPKQRGLLGNKFDCRRRWFVPDYLYDSISNKYKEPYIHHHGLRMHMLAKAEGINWRTCGYFLKVDPGEFYPKHKFMEYAPEDVKNTYELIEELIEKFGDSADE